MAFLTGQRLTADLLNQNLQGYSTSIVANSGTYTTTETVIATWTATLTAGQVYAVTADAFILTSATSSTEANLVRIREDSLTGTQVQGGNIMLPSTTSGGCPLHLYGEYTAVSTATKTFVLTAIRQGTGTGTYNLKASSTSPCIFRVQPLVN